ncbi:GyrI-like domain-containing protein [Pseudoalteromonas fenneropenaei]|uniref:GyrI-like domain-containing protein n=1 Tax=Pseudoalteromonas fenneropenaei TaxID=1737459 RepID=A0ABV7CN88_9GAMM
MSKQRTQHHYQKRLLAVIDYMYQHIEQDLDVNTLADVACMSCYHFHRIYREFAGEPVNVTVRRIRLFKAATFLVHSDLSLADIAKRVKYGSVEAFHRAFCKQYGETPLRYRQLRNSQALEGSVFYPTNWKEYKTMYQVEQCKTDAVALYGIAHQGDFMQIGQAFEKLTVLATNLGLLNQQTRFFGVYYDDPKSVPVEQLRAMACISVAQHTDLEHPQLQKLTIPAGETISLLFKGDYTELEQPYEWLFGQWLPQSNLELADFPPFEEYLNDNRTTAPQDLLTRINCLLKV